MKLDLTSLNNAIVTLEKSVNSFTTLSTKDIITNDDIQTLKAGVIHNFEVFPSYLENGQLPCLFS